MKNKLNSLLFLLNVAFLFLVVGPASAQSKKTTKIDFEDELIEGSAKKPELMYLMQKKQFNFKKLIKLREDFLPEMTRTAEELPRGGGND